MAAARELARADLGETVHAVRCGTTFIYGCARSSFEWFSCMSMILVCRNSLSSRGPLARRAATRERRRPSHRHALTAPLAHRTPHTGRHSRHGQPTWTRPTATLRGIRSDREASTRAFERGTGRARPTRGAVSSLRRSPHTHSRRQTEVRTQKTEQTETETESERERDGHTHQSPQHAPHHVAARARPVSGKSRISTGTHPFDQFTSFHHAHANTHTR